MNNTNATTTKSENMSNKDNTAEHAICENCLYYKPTNDEIGVCMFKIPTRNGRPQTCPLDRCGFFTDKETLSRPLYFFVIHQNNSESEQC